MPDSTSSTSSTAVSLEVLDVPLERDVFLRTLLRHLAGTLQDVIGLDDASGFVSVVGQEMGEQMDQMYRNALAVDQLSADQVAAVLVDLKRRIQGDFYIIEHDDEKIVLGNRACPFGDKVKDRPALCMMTSNVFGSITAENLGYAKVHLQETIASGDDGCRIVVYLKPTDESDNVHGRVYVKS
ncbi:methanogen output domain 1-containing protein [Phycisphaerales bacterium AB-hyl4]|uniref:Methanogen output domain 1-containing protein n=1 Tax=Natronomicrosphaera hydrolytica TaxID=3242702 RepID=A0ABV4U1F8_9BACT